MIKVPEEQVAQLYELRLAMFLEDEPQSNYYRQIIFNADQFKRMSDLLDEILKEGAFISSQLTSLPTELNSYIDEEELE